MTKSAVRVAVGTRLLYDGEAAEVVELQPSKSGIDLTLRIGAGARLAVRITMRELLDGGRARIIGDDAASGGPSDLASVVLNGLSEVDVETVRTRAAHVSRGSDRIPLGSGRGGRPWRATCAIRSSPTIDGALRGQGHRTRRHSANHRSMGV